MKKILIEKYRKIIQNKEKLKNALNVDIKNRGKEIFINGLPENEYFAEKVIDALSFGFSFEKAILIKKEDLIFEIINIKDYTKRKDLERIRGRIIGTGGKTLKVLSSLTECFFELKDNQIGIIGSYEQIENARQACISIIRGAKQSNVYAYLEKNKPLPIYDLNLKNKE